MMSLKPLDVLVFTPLIPVLPAVVTWYLPWERWIPKWLPRKVIGPYLLYCAFGAWYFNMPWWFVLLVGIWGTAICGYGIYEHFQYRRSTPRE